MYTICKCGHSISDHKEDGCYHENKSVMAERIVFYCACKTPLSKLAQEAEDKIAEMIDEGLDRARPKQ